MTPRQIRAWKRLATDYPWPDEKPEVGHHPIPGWLNKGTAKYLSQHIPIEGLVVELGTWRGLSARRMLSRMSAAKVVCIDHWEGSPEHTVGCYADRVKDLLPKLWEHFVADSWRFRNHIVPLKMDTLAGLHVVHRYGLKPDLIYVDAGHEFEPVFNDISVATALFPGAIIVGDDWYIEGVREAAKLLNKRLEGRYEFEHNVKSFYFRPLS